MRAFSRAASGVMGAARVGAAAAARMRVHLHTDRPGVVDAASLQHFPPPPQKEGKPLLLPTRMPQSLVELRKMVEEIKAQPGISKSAKRDKLKRLFHRYETMPLPGQTPPPPPPGVEFAVVRPVPRDVFRDLSLVDDPATAAAKQANPEKKPPPPRPYALNVPPAPPPPPRRFDGAAGDSQSVAKIPPRRIDAYTTRQDVLNMEGLSRITKRNKIKKIRCRTAPPSPSPPHGARTA